jgi:Flp pilus assembly pilin Flp
MENKLDSNTSAVGQPGVSERKKHVRGERKEEKQVSRLSGILVSIRENRKGQTMTEYVLIIAAIAVAGYTAYVGLEGGINTIITSVTATLKGA